MADQILKLKDIEDFFFDITCHMLGYTTEEEMSKVRIAWQSDGAPSWKIDEDVVLLRVTPEDNRMARELNILYDTDETDLDNLKRKTGYARTHKINWTLYGPNSYDNADLLRSHIFANEYMVKFKKQNLFLVTDVPMPTRIPEFYNKQWWDRTDFSATFTESVIREAKVPFITGAEVIVLKNK
ncbi:hypothetical protein EUAN_08580 [Andreesenia angusta]|uniref:Phage neck terminator protein gp12-like domain-containing protein n=1 Tax=Andreesenia angusta TaxID=39480 RepID=A0A1S1V989_9FIRM|nr:hypothetical protein [Andreesenia angusta]OHW63074.1 hypothetical protein EUAN_08580 [Andreesenia angusta]